MPSPHDAPRLAAGRGGPIVPAQPRWHGRLAAQGIRATVSALDLTLRWTREAHPDAEDAIRSGRVIFAIWHNRLALCIPAYRRAVHREPGRRMAALVSASRDGGVLAQVLDLFDVLPIRGSSSRRGAQALREFLTAAESGRDLALTPDGPRGPRYEIQEGVMVAAQFTGLPIIPVAWSLGWKLRLRSWDAFQVPLPFSTCRLRLGPPLRVPRKADAHEREALRQALLRQLLSITQD